MPIGTNAHRLYIWDYIRSFTFFVLLIDHAFHAYAPHFNRWHFISDQGVGWIDYVYLYNNNIIMPMLFFVIGLFVIPSLRSKGFFSFLKGRFYRLGIPWIAGICFIVPFLVYPRFLLENPELTLHDFLFKIYFPNRMQGGGPFWVLWYVFFLTLLAILLNRWTPIFTFIAHLIGIWNRRPFLGTCAVVCLVILILLISDLYFGPYHWIGFVNFFDPPSYASDTPWWYHGLKLFKVQGSRFLVQGLFFMIGVAIGGSHWMEEPSLWRRLAASWKTWMCLSLSAFFLYGFYVSSYLNESFELLFSNTLPILLREHYEGPRLQQAFHDYLAVISPRLILQGLTLVMTSLAWIGLFHHLFTKRNALFCLYTQNSFGIFLLHEIPVIWMQYILIGQPLSIFAKLTLTCMVSFMSTFFVVMGLRKLPGVSKVLS